MARFVARFGLGGLGLFSLIWLGQLISIVGSGLTEFGLGVWVFQHSGAATDYALVVFFITLPHVLVSPFAGPLVDRWDRRRVMIVAECGAALTSLAVALLAWDGALELWQVYLAVLATSTCAAFMFPAYTALVSQLVSKEQLGRASGMIEMAWAAGLIVAPMAAAVLLGIISLSGMLLLDVVSFLVGIGILLAVRVPKFEPAAAQTTDAPKTPFFRELAYGWTFISQRPGLVGLLTFFVLVNFSVGLFNALFAPMVLSFAAAGTLGTIVSIGGSGLLVGGLVMAAWGGPKRRVRGIILVGPLFGLCMIAIGLEPSAYLIAAAGFLYTFCQPFINGCDQAIWQTKVPLEVQGRVFATRRSIEHASGLLAYLAAGPLADRVFGPLLAPDGALAASLGPIMGVGPGRGIGLLFVLMGLATLLTAVWGNLTPRIRLIEDNLPDAAGVDEAPAAVAEDPAVAPSPLLEPAVA